MIESLAWLLCWHSLVDFLPFLVPTYTAITAIRLLNLIEYGRPSEFIELIIDISAIAGVIIRSDCRG